MKWYYAEKKDAIGPLSEDEFQSLIIGGKVTPATLVWHQGMKNWQQYRQVKALTSDSPSAAPDADEPKSFVCSQCGVPHSVDEMFRYGDLWACAGCKPLLVQKLKEGGSVTQPLRYAGFWIRFGAQSIDLMIYCTIIMIFRFGANLLIEPYADSYITMTLGIFIGLVNLLIFALYTVWFLGTFGATPGKMAFNLRVVTADGENISYVRALGRHYAEWISFFLAGIGYYMVGFDSEKRGLHDRISYTRVIKE